MNHKSVCGFLDGKNNRLKKNTNRQTESQTCPSLACRGKIREGKEEGESDEVTGERRREEMKGSRGSEKSAEGGLGRRREKADGEDGGAAEGASG